MASNPLDLDAFKQEYACPSCEGTGKFDLLGDDPEVDCYKCWGSGYQGDGMAIKMLIEEIERLRQEVEHG